VKTKRGTVLGTVSATRRGENRLDLLHTLNIANSSQLKDRVERAHKNLQDPRDFAGASSKGVTLIEFHPRLSASPWGSPTR
jgi:hypothetical protein